MKSKDLISIGSPIKLRLEFDGVTVAELSNILRQWNALLRVAWRESYAIHYGGRAPNAHILVASASTENSFEVIADIALPLAANASILGPAIDWLTLARIAYGYLASRWREREEQREADVSSHLYLRGGETPELRVSTVVLANRKIGDRIERMWDTANSGGIRLTVEELDDADGRASEVVDIDRRT